MHKVADYNELTIAHDTQSFWNESLDGWHSVRFASVPDEITMYCTMGNQLAKACNTAVSKLSYVCKGLLSCSYAFA